jgi:hypothetical protein
MSALEIPRCRCHGEPMRRNGKVTEPVYQNRAGQQEWCCAVKRREQYGQKKAA